MKWLIWVMLAAPVAGLAREWWTRKEKPAPGVLYLHPVWRISCHLISAVFGFMALMAPGNDPKMMVMLGLCMAFIQWAAWASCRYRAWVKDDILTVIPYWGKARSLPLNQITRVTRMGWSGQLVLYQGKKPFCRIPSACVGYESFRAMLESRGLMDL